MKNIWIIDHYSSEPKYGGISRHYDFAKQLSELGYRVVVISSAYSHFTHSYITNDKYTSNEFYPNAFYVYLRTKSYYGNGGMMRALNMFDFMFKVARHRKLIERKCGKPDVVLGCSVHPLSWIAAYRISKKYKVKFCVEVRDFWPRIWVASGEKSKLDPMVIFFEAVQKWAYRKADRIIYSMFHGNKYICGELGVPKEKVFLIGQPMDCERFDRNSGNINSLPANINEFISDGFICSFAGYYMTYEGVYVMLEAAMILKQRGIPVKMVFIGSGQEKDEMIKYTEDHNLDNVQINDRIPKEAVPALLSRSDICMAHLEVKGHRDVYKYGVSKNKVNEYLYSGACTLYGFLYNDDAVATSGGGIVFEPFNSLELADNIEKVYCMKKQERKQFGQNGRKYIKEYHSIQVLTKKLLKVLFEE